jgi:hypothetical protein
MRCQGTRSLPACLPEDPHDLLPTLRPSHLGTTKMDTEKITGIMKSLFGVLDPALVSCELFLAAVRCVLGDFGLSTS